MGYMHISNLYKDNTIQMFRECYALEKVHGTSAHVGYRNTPTEPENLIFFSGGEKRETFLKIFDEAKLLGLFRERGCTDITLYGEAYGGKMQRMSETYGVTPKFVVFDVRIGDKWCDVPVAERLALAMGLEFVAYEKVSTNQESLDAERDRPSRQAIRNGCGIDKKAEGVVLRPLKELTDNRGNRIMCKHKRADFSERASKADTVAPEKAKILADAQAIAEEWVTPMRLEHVVDHLKAELQRELTMADLSTLIQAMVEDVFREGAGEIVESKEARKAVGAKCAILFRRGAQSD